MLLDWISSKRKTLDSIFRSTAKKKRRKNLTKERRTQTHTHIVRVCAHTSHKHWYNLYEMCSMNFEPSVFFINFSLSSKSFAKKLKNFNVNARVRWNGVNQFRAHTHIEFEYGSCVAEKRISHCEYHSLWHAKNVLEKNDTHLKVYFHHKVFGERFFNFTHANDKDRCVSTLYPKREIVCLLDTFEQ